jgi:NAD(P)-dependent dehydrogenase (short-subunit alcohol dehydrogenase family)
MTRSPIFAAAVLLLVLAGYAPVLIADDATTQKAVLVTGSSSGIGRKKADLERLDAMDNVSAVRLDVTVQEDINAAVEFVRHQGRGLYGVVNNAGVGSISLLATGLESDMDFVFDVNVYGPFRVNHGRERGSCQHRRTGRFQVRVYR